MQDPTSSRNKTVRSTLTGSGNVHVTVPKVKLASVAAPYVPDPDSDFDQEDMKPVVTAKKGKKRKLPSADAIQTDYEGSKKARGVAGTSQGLKRETLLSTQAGPSRFATNTTTTTTASTSASTEHKHETESLNTYPDDSLDFKIHKRQAREGSRNSSSKPEATSSLNADEPAVISDSDEDLEFANDMRRGFLNKTARQRKLDEARDQLNEIDWDQQKAKKRAGGAPEKSDPLTSPLAILLGIYTPLKSTPPPPSMKTIIQDGIAKRVPMVEVDDDATASESEDVDMDGVGRSTGSGEGNGSGPVKEYTGSGETTLQKGIASAQTIGDAEASQSAVVPKRWTSLKQFQKDVGKKVRRNRQADDEAYESAQKIGMKPFFFLRGGFLPQNPLVLDPLRGDQVPIAINRFLRQYQRHGVEFFYERYRGLKTSGEHGIKVRGGILGDDMGLGKTIQVIAFLSAIMHKTGTKKDVADRNLRSYKVRNRADGQWVGPTTFGPTALIVCPTTVMDNWERELQMWGYFELGRLENKADDKRVLNRYKQGFFDIVLTSHTTLRAVRESLEDVHFSVVIIDEAHALKNPKSNLSISAKGLKADARFALTGTLVQNRYSEMWSVLDFVAPGQIGTQQHWKELISNPLDEGNKHNATMEETLKARDIAYTLYNDVMPNFFLRRTKAKVAEELPEKNDQVIFCPLTPIQEVVYERITRCKAMQYYLKKDDACYCGAIGDKGKPKTRKDCHFPPQDSDPNYGKLVLRYLAILNKISSHIALIYPQANDSMAQNELSRKLLDVCFPDPGNMDDEEDSDVPALACDAEFRQMNAYRAGLNVNMSGKWQVLTCLLQAWHQDVVAQNQVLIFSTSVRLLNILEEYANREGYKSVTLTGKVTGKDRMDVVDAFQNHKDCFIFFISTLAGGVGLNLTAANKVIIFDPSWNPANDLQAMDRAFRMGQKRDVDVYRLISKGTIEENIYERQLRKESAMRIIYTASLEPRRWAGTEKDSKETTGNDLYGVRNMFTYNREGSTLQRDARLLETETTVTGGNNVLKGLKTLQVDTTYAEDSEGAFETKETDDGGFQELDTEKNERDLLDFLGLNERSDAGAAAVSELAKVTSGLMARAHVHEAQDSEAERRIYEAGKALQDDPAGKRKARMTNAYQLTAAEAGQKVRSRSNVKREAAEQVQPDTPHAPKVLTGALIDDDDDDDDDD